MGSEQGLILFRLLRKEIMYDQYQKYIYDGPVMLFDRCVADHWRGETMAPTKTKARSNLAFQAKKQMNLIAGTKVTLPGEIKMVN